MPRAELKVKGQSFHAVVRAFAELRSDAFGREVVAAMQGDGGIALRDGSLLPANFYPVAWYRDLFRTACELAPDALDLARDAGRVSGERDLNGIYKWVVRALSTEMLIRQSPRLFHIVYQGGGVEVVELRSGFARIRYYDCHGFDRNVWQDAVGGASAVFTATGARKLVMRVEEGGRDGDTTMLVAVSWL